MRLLKIFLSIVFNLTIAFTVCAQSSHTLILRQSLSEPVSSTELPPAVQKNIRNISAYLRQLLLNLHHKGYVLASLDSVQTIGDTTLAWLYTGNRFRWVALEAGNVPEPILREVGYKERLLREKPFSYRQVATLEENILTASDNRGYPFATVALDSLKIADNTIKARLQYTPGPYILFDTLEVKGSARLKTRFLATYLRIQKGQPYNEASLQRGQRWLGQLPYLTVKQPYTVTLLNDRAYPVFYLDSRRANVIDGIVGLQPNEQASNKLLVTGQLNLQLRNLFGSGKNFLLQWQQIRQASPKLDLIYEHPAFLQTPLTVKVNFNLLKEDSTFFNINQQLGFSYALNKAGSLQTWVRLRNSRLGTVASALQPEVLPAYSDTRLLAYGVGYSWDNLDDPFYPLRGTGFQLSTEAGNKTILKNPAVDQTLYDGIPLSSAQFSVQVEIQKFTSLSRRSTLLVQARGGKLLNENLFLNELFRLGGLASLRGFNENFFYAAEYATGTLEYRHFIEPTSYLFLFYDQGWLKYQLRNAYAEDGPSGFGAGISLSTTAGIFNFVYAVGNSKDRPFGLTFSKIHFGYVSRF